MKTLYLDLISGIAGDMFVAALIDLGANPQKLERELRKLNLDGYHLHVSRGERSAIAGTRFEVHVTQEHEGHHFHAHDHCLKDAHTHGHSLRGERNFSDIEQLIEHSRLSAWVKQKSIAVFAHIARAEGKIHGVPPEKVHFHEVGAVDSIVDIVGAAIGLEMLGKPRVAASPVVEGIGWVNCAHGKYPVPAPATLAILGARRIGITQCDEPNELVTPTGAALLAEFVETFGGMENLVAEKIGFGLGTRENKTRPNVLRAVLGTAAHAAKAPTAGAGVLDWETDRIAVLETNLDDCPGEILGVFLENALAQGALDVFHTPIQMKKNRPATLLTVLCPEAEAEKFAELILRETTAFGVRKTVAERRKLRREFTEVATTYGKITMKIGRLGGEAVQIAPELDSARKLSAKTGTPVKRIFQAADAATVTRKPK